MLILCDEVNILNTFRVMIILRLLLLLTNLHLKLLSTQGTGADKLLSTQRVQSSLNKNYWWLHASENPSSILCAVSGHICTSLYQTRFSGIVYSIMSNKTLPYH